ncbi:MAG: LacI family DNA-binding transcriptional regulator [Arcanobacterium sp.]|nr:LacI family DNA-binding transcriptional regulator [Arcanobacterium sp.]MDY5589656.1 LacI family DNA-binding transcriptional regulator [Arcanobacterium sp.]
MPVTIADIAQKTGASKATVSLVLSGHSQGRVSKERAAYIAKVAHDMKYVRNGLAGALRKRKSKTIGFVSDVVASTPYAYEMVAAANRRANELGYLLLIAETVGDPERTQQVFSTLMSYQVEVLAYASMHHHEVVLPRIRPEHVMILDGYSSDPGAISAVPDEVQGAKTAVEHLIELGHRKIAFINDARSKDAGPLRLQGYREALSAAGIPLQKNMEIPTATQVEETDKAAMKVLDQVNRPTAIYCFNDKIATAVYRTAYRLGLRIPDDLSVVGFDNFRPIAETLDPPLTTIKLPHAEIAEWGINELVAAHQGRREQLGDTRKKFFCPIVIRNSTTVPMRN